MEANENDKVEYRLAENFAPVINFLSDAKIMQISCALNTEYFSSIKSFYDKESLK